MAQFSILFPTTDDACKAAARKVVRLILEYGFGFSLFDVRKDVSEILPEGPDELVQDGVVRGWYRKTGEKDHSVLLQIEYDHSNSDEAQRMHSALQVIMNRVFVAYRAHDRDQISLMVSIQYGRLTSFVRPDDVRSWTLGGPHQESDQSSSR